MQRASRLRCSLWLLSYLWLQLLCLSITGFLHSELDFLRLKEATAQSESLVLPSGEECQILFSPGGASVKYCYRYDREERFLISDFIYHQWDGEGLHERSRQSIESELALHSLAYRVGIAKEHSVDAEIDTKEDDRWWVSGCALLLETLGI